MLSEVSTGYKPGKCPDITEKLLTSGKHVRFNNFSKISFRSQLKCLLFGLEFTKCLSE